MLVMAGRRTLRVEERCADRDLTSSRSGQPSVVWTDYPRFLTGECSITPGRAAVATRSKSPQVPQSQRWLATRCAALLAGCTSTHCRPHRSLTPTPFESVSSVQPRVQPLLECSSRHPTSSTSGRCPNTAIATATPSITNPWPADLTPDQVTQAQAAIAAYVGYGELVDRANPIQARIGSAEAAQWATDPAKSSLLQNLA